MTDPNDLAVRLAAARLAEADAHAMHAAALRADADRLTEFYRGRLAEARRVVVRLEREQAEVVRAWVAANCGGRGHAE